MFKTRTRKKATIFFAFAFVFVASLVVPVKSHAQVLETARDVYDLIRGLTSDGSGDVIRDMLCEPTKVIYRGIMLDQQESSIVRTHYFITAAASLNLIYSTMGASLDYVVRCIPGPIGMAVNAMCEAQDGFQWSDLNPYASTELYCTPIQRLFATSDTESEVAGLLPSSGNTSLAAMATSLNRYNENSKAPANMAYYFNKRMAKVPVVGKTFAASADFGSYRGWFIDEVIVAWQIMRNLAFTCLAVYVFYVGILIITRKHLDQRTVVSVQYALPKLGIAIFLIAFSYTIGAFIATNAWVLSHSMKQIVKGAVEATSPTPIGDWWFTLNIVGYLVTIVLVGLLSAGIGFAIMGVILLIVLALYLYLEIKVLLLHMKIIVSIITAPLEFLWYSIPGSEKKVGDWFKKVLAYALGMVSIRGIFWLTIYIGGVMVNSNFQTANDGGDFAFAALFLVFALPIVLCFGMIQAIKAPKKVEALLMGEKKRR